MAKDFRPFISKLRIQDWTDKNTGTVTPGIAIHAFRGVTAHLTAEEARAIADKLHDLSDKLEQPALERRTLTPVHTSQTLTAADGTEEPALPSTAPQAEPAPAKRRVIRRITPGGKKVMPWNL